MNKETSHDNVQFYYETSNQWDRNSL
uniref:Uncharacterized protein n=1 Tax=Arundo donax TaxID=35708 RepID=A0A0A8ZKX3_ARUDO